MRIFDVLLDLLQMSVFFFPIMHYNSISLFILSAIDVTRYFWPSWTILICLFRFSIWFVNLQTFRWSDRFSKRITFVISYQICNFIYVELNEKWDENYGQNSWNFHLMIGGISHLTFCLLICKHLLMRERKQIR